MGHTPDDEFLSAATSEGWKFARKRVCRTSINGGAAHGRLSAMLKGAPVRISVLSYITENASGGKNPFGKLKNGK
jgi:hypothetical protein